MDVLENSPASKGAPDDPLDRRRMRGARRAFVADLYLPTPDRDSGSLRMVNLLALLREVAFDVTFAATTGEAPEPYASDLQMQGIEVIYPPYVPSPVDYLQTRGAELDLVLLSRADAARRLMPVARRFCPRARIVFDTVDLHYLREQRLAALAGSAVTRALAHQRRREELALIRDADTTLVVSPVERDLLARDAPQADVRVLSNIHRIPGAGRSFAQRQGIVFVGGFAHPPNVDAVLWFCREILPEIRRQEPSLVLSVIGADPPAAIRRLASDGVAVLGFVPDLVPHLDAARISIAPLRYGAGVKGKINQSLAHGLPVVATPLAAEGMHLLDGESVLLAAEPHDFAAAVLRLYRDPALWARLSAGGLTVMERHFSFDAARAVLRDLVGASTRA